MLIGGKCHRSLDDPFKRTLSLVFLLGKFSVLTSIFFTKHWMMLKKNMTNLARNGRKTKSKVQKPQ
jgi:hypothetical protein